MSFLTILLSLSALFGADPEASPQDTTMSERASRTTVVEFKRDKVIYSATKFMFLPSESLADLLNCLPGVYVYSNGTATVNAATMGSIKINSVPFVPSDKTIPLNMISADKVERIEVSGASINVILKSETGNSHIAEATLAAGTSFHPKYREGDSPNFLYRGKFILKEDGKKSRTTLYGIALNSSDTDMGIGVLSNNMSSRTRLSSQGLLTNLKAGLPFCPAGTISK